MTAPVEPMPDDIVDQIANCLGSMGPWRSQVRAIIANDRIAAERRGRESAAAEMDYIKALASEAAQLTLAAEHRAVAAQARIAVLEAALHTLIGYCEIAAVCPQAIGKTLVYALDGPELNEARAALSASEVKT